MIKPYQVLPPTAPVPAPDDVLEMVVREGARKMLQSMLEAEVDDFLGRRRYQRTAEYRGYRNGRLPERTIGVGMGAVEVSLPRVSDVPPEVSPEGFHSDIVSRYQRRSRTQARLLARLYLEGLASGDFEPVFRALVGETAALSPSSILKLKADWQQEYETWKKRPLRGRYVYVYADGFYLKAGGDQDKTAVLVVLGVDEQGHKELLAMEQGYRESTNAWSEVLRSLKERGLVEAPLLAVGDGALGLWAALDEIFPATRHQRCWNHRTLNVLDKLPKRFQPEVRKTLHALAEAPTRQECERRRDALCARLRGLGQTPAATCLERDWEDFVTLYDFPEEHWVHLRTSNPIEFIFSVVRLRTNASKRVRVRESALYLVFKLVLRLSLNWRGFNAPNQLRLLLDDHQFRDGQLVLEDARTATLARAVGA
ncbi:MAG: IS256 family transposase [Chloroflexota bacterium]|nr:IS256 family transposase [Chloroflexota bacterium]